MSCLQLLPKSFQFFFYSLFLWKRRKTPAFLGKMNTGCKCFAGLLSSLHVFKKKLIIMLCCSHHSLENAIWVITPVPRQNCTLPCGILLSPALKESDMYLSLFGRTNQTLVFTNNQVNCTEKEVNVQIFRCWNKYCLKPVSSLKKVLKLLVFF